MAGIIRRREGAGQSSEMSQQAGAREPMRRLSTWDPFRSLGMADPFRSLGMGDPLRRMRELFSWDPFGEMETMIPAGRTFMPDIEVREKSGEYVICADLPGLHEEDVSVEIAGNRLTISGKREEEQREEKERYWAYERSYGSFTRSFTLPEGTEADKIDAHLVNGVLEVHIPKSQMEESKRIPLKTEAKQAERGAESGVRRQPTGGSQTGGQQAAEEGQGGSREKAA